MSNNEGYAFEFKGHGVFTPDGRADGITDAVKHNRELEAKELEWLRTGPEKVFLYVRMPDAITTFLGTPVATHVVVGLRVRMGFGGAYRRSVSCKIFGVRYVGWYMESSGSYCRLRRTK